MEKTAHNTAERIKRAVTLNAVIAWRLSALTLLGRATPELPAENLFAKSEIAMLLDYAHHMGFSLPCQETPGDMPELDAVSLGEAVLLVARLGGYLNRKNDGPPGHQVVWEGYARLATGAQTIERIEENGSRRTARRAPRISISPGTPGRVQRPAPQMRGISPDDRYRSIAE